jgi:hypothetical protein
MSSKPKTIEGVTEVRDGKRLIGVVYQRQDGAYDAIAFGGMAPIRQHDYTAVDTAAEGVEWIEKFNAENYR